PYCSGVASSPSFSLLHTSATSPYTLSLHDALPICLDDVDSAVLDHVLDVDEPLHAYRLGQAGGVLLDRRDDVRRKPDRRRYACRSEEHTSELQSRENLVCRLLLEKKKRTSRK